MSSCKIIQKYRASKAVLSLVLFARFSFLHSNEKSMGEMHIPTSSILAAFSHVDFMKFLVRIIGPVSTNYSFACFPLLCGEFKRTKVAG